MEDKELTQTEREEYQTMKLNFQKFKEDSIFYEGAIKKLLRAVPNIMLIEEAKRRKLIKRNWELRNG